MNRVALFPGTFDPITIGHLDIIQRALPLFDKLIIGIGRNANKAAMFTEELRLQWVNEIYKNEPNVSGIIYEGLTVECCQKVGANFIIRGIRYVNDFEYEKAIADMNRSLDPEIETVLLPASASSPYLFHPSYTMLFSPFSSGNLGLALLRLFGF